MKTAFVALFIVLVSFSSFSQTCALPKPAFLTVTQTSSCSVSLNWAAVVGAASYKISYKVSSSTVWMHTTVASTVLNYNLSNLIGGNIYNFKVNALCNNNRSGKAQARNLLLVNYCASIPLLDSSKVISPGMVRLFCHHNATLNYQISYTDSATNITQTVLDGNALFYFDVKNLASNHTYVFKIRSSCCTNTYSAWSNTLTAHTFTRPNIVLFIMDDVTDRTFDFDNGPSFFQTPALDFLASEGMHLKNYFTVYSLCAPSRGVLLTGLYPHQNGVTSNLHRFLSHNIPTLGTVLDTAGYYNGFVGKVHVGSSVKEGFDIFYSGPVVGSASSYINPYFTDRFGNRTQFTGHLTDITTQFGINFLDSVPAGVPFFLILSQLSPHGPDVPRPQDAGYYLGLPMPIPVDYQKYVDDYPSFLYSNWDSLLYDSINYSEQVESYYDQMKGDEASLQQFIDTLISRNLWNNTLFILTGDNGSLWGSHQLMNKRLPYEQSIRIPGVIKFPTWFPAGSTFNQTVINTDIAPTILDAVGIDYTRYNMQGVSIRQLFNNEVHRNGFLYESYWEDNYPEMPGVRTIRTDYYKYNKYNCNTITEEFFDLQNDSLELTNLINDPAYQTIIQSYRLKLDSIRLAENDVLPPDSILPCSLINNLPFSSSNRFLKSDFPIVTNSNEPIKLFPDPVHDVLMIYCEGIIESATIYNLEGQLLFTSNDLTVHRMDTSMLQPGMYTLQLKFYKKDLPVNLEFVKQ